MGLLLVLIAYPGLWGLLGCFVGCARMWVLGAGGLIGCLCWLCSYVGDSLPFIRCIFVSD